MAVNQSGHLYLLATDGKLYQRRSVGAVYDATPTWLLLPAPKLKQVVATNNALYAIDADSRIVILAQTGVTHVATDWRPLQPSSNDPLALAASPDPLCLWCVDLKGAV